MDQKQLHIGKYDIFFKKRYEIMYNINDFLIAILFLIGSIFFFYDSLQYYGIWLFVIGSIQLSIRPFIRIIHNIHFKKHIEKQQKNRRS
ncbi:YrhK family protein [Aquibacillus sp. 3ASR75-11]|uniref:YrhK family protein n=1 Tax=Terrihalobacillus insolitus TaxID=2950438 RepID=A0A9X3WQ69_9BACI|nr:YrhK family protein [Terrihalobacillus insolitus]MDC3412738.1 YrhK family protein [Terrihalobacillus insolitus]MDC3423785.1 YrhK family protein [Terrihalobacillus insolitus]